MASAPENWNAIKALFQEALALKPEDRADFLQNCPADEEVRDEVKRLLSEYTQAETFLSAPVLSIFSAEPEPVRQLSVGDLLTSRFRISRFIAGGGMGEVYEAQDLELRERVALKTIRRDILQHPNALALFKQEVHLARKVTHPNVCRVFDLFRHTSTQGEEIVFVSMELLYGKTLDERLRELGRLGIEETLDLVRQMTAALSAAHLAGIVHRDFKPGNIVLVPDEEKQKGVRVVVTDFGLALRSVRTLGSSESTAISVTADCAGTPAYMAPEQIAGGPATAASDIYALGLVIYEMVTGARPFQGETPVAATLKRLSEPPIPPRQFVPELNSVWEKTILRCLERNPADRFTKVQDVVAELAHGVDQPIPGAAPELGLKVGQTIRTVATERARPHLRIIVGAGIILLLNPFVGGTVSLLAQMLSRSTPHSLAYVCTVIFDVVTFYFFLRFEKARSAAEKARKRLENWAQTSRSAAFRGLDPFSEVDTLPGTERKRQARRLVTSIKDLSFRFGVVSGDVGCGKTSLLQSEVQRLLKSNNFIPILLSRASIVDTENITDLCHAMTTATTLDRSSRIRVLIIDQLEEILIRFPGRQAREELGAFLGTMIRGDRPVKVVCAVRKDYFLDLYDLGAAMDVDVRPTLMLHNFTPAEAKDVIVECAVEEGLTLADELIETIVADLTKESQVRPPELQIVCTALTANFTTQNYKELGAAKGILESYLRLTLETCADQQVARLILRLMCDFEKQAKADAKTVDELAEAIGPLRDDSGVTVRVVRQVLDHLVRSRIAAMVGGKFGLIHDYWVSIIRDTTVHDRSEQEKANELLRRYLHEQETGLSSILRSSQLRLVRRFAKPDLLNSQAATTLLRKSTIRLWILRGIAVAIFTAVIIGGAMSSTVTWQMVVLADLGGQGIWNRELVKEAGLLIMDPLDFGPQERSSISAWSIKSGRRVSEFTADAWAFSAENGALLYTNQNQGNFVDFTRNRQSKLLQVFQDGRSIGFSRSAHCALYTFSTNNGKGSAPDELVSYQAELWALPEGRSLARTTLTASNLVSSFVSDKCDRAVLLSTAGASLISRGGGVSDVQVKNKPWLWDVSKSKPMLITSKSTASRASLAVDERTESLAVLETDTKGLTSIGLWNLQNGRQRLVRSIEQGLYSFAYLRFSSDRQYIKIFSHLSSAIVSGQREKVTVVRTSDLQPPEMMKKQSLTDCRIEDSDDAEASDYLLWLTSSQYDSIWDVTGADPVRLYGLNSSDVIDCAVSPDRSGLVLLRKTGSAELWSFKGNKIADLRAGGPVNHVFWTLQGTDVGLVRDTGQIVLFDAKGVLQAMLQAPGSGSRTMTSDSPAVSFVRSCKHIVVWTSGARVVRYTKKLQVFGLPYLLPIWHRAIPSCD